MSDNEAWNGLVANERKPIIHHCCSFFLPDDTVGMCGSAKDGEKKNYLLGTLNVD